MASERTAEDPVIERSSLPLDIDDVHVLLQVEQEQIQKRTFTNWVNAQLSKRRPPVVVLDLFNDFRDGSRLLDLLEVMCGQRMSREKGKGVFQHRTNIEKALAFLRGKSIKLVNINVPDIMDGKPSIILGLIWTIIMHFHIEELACTLSFSSRQSSLESLASLDTRSTSSSARNSPVPPHGSPLHTRFRISAKKALLLWVREQCHKAGCTLNVKDFKASWRSGVVFLAILCALRPDVVSLSKARSQSNRQNLEEAFHIAERELHIPRLLDPADVDVRDPDEKSIMTYVAQFLQYTKDTPASEEDMQVQYLTPTSRASPVNLPCNFTPAVAASPSRQTSSTQKVQEVTCWLEQAYQELLEGWESTEGESYAERYHVFQTFVVSFNEQRRPVMPLLTAMKRTTKLSEEQRALRHAWDSLAEKLREYKTELDLSLPSPLDAVGRWLLRAEETLADGDDNCQDHARAAQEAREKHEMFKSCLEEMPRHMKTFQVFRNKDEYGETAVPTDKLEEIKRRFTTVRVSAKYHGIRLDYQDLRHTVLDLLAQLNIKLRTWKRGYVSQEAVRVLLKDWNETVNKQGLPSMLEETLRKLRHIANKYTSKSALAGDSNRVSNQMKDIETETAAIFEEVRMVKGTISRTLTAWDSYCDSYTSLHAWLEQGSQTYRHGQQSEVTIDMMSEWSSCRERLNEVGNYLTDVTDPQTSRSVSDNLCRINLMWADFVRRTQFELVEEPSVTSQSLQGLIREATQLLKEPLEVLSGSLRTYRKRLQFMMKKIQDVDLDSLSPSLEFSTETLSKFKQAIPEVLRTLCEAMQVSEELQQTVSSLDGRLAELIHWEAEVREFYELLKDKSHRLQREQDSRTRSLISRGLQLEGQVVMEEQDLQEMVMSHQKNSPLQYLMASTMQDRVRSTVTQSQEAVGMLSSLGIRRDRSPTGHQPPRKVFVQEQTVTKPETQPQTVPMIVVQEYQEEKSQIQQVAKSQLSQESVKDLLLQSKPEAHAQQQVLTEVKPQANLVDVVAFGETKRKIPSNTKETMESQSYHLDTKQTQKQIHPAPLIAHEEPTQPQMQSDFQQQTQGQQQQMHKQEQGTSQQQALFQQSVKVRKSQKRADNRPWLHQKVQAEGKPSSPQPNVIATAVSKASEPTADTVQAQAKVTCIQQQKPVTVTTSDASQAQVSAADANQFQAKKVTQTQAKMTQAQQQQSVQQAKVIQAQQQNPMTVVSSVASQVTEVQQQQSVMQVTQTKVGQVQQQQPVTQAKLGQVHQQSPASEMLVKEPKVPAMVPVKSQKQSQATTIQQHPQPFTATTFNHPPTNLSQMQLPGMTQMQRPGMTQTQPPIMSETYQYLPAMGKESQTLIHPSTPIQPQIIIQRQPNPVAAHSLPQQAISPNQSQGVTATPAKTKSTAPIQPRIITMPKNQPEFYKPSQSPPQTMGVGQTYGNVQLRPQPHIQQPQWRPIVPDIMTQSYNEAPHQGFIPSHMPPQMQIQSHTQSQGVTQTQQWGPLRGGLMTQTYPNVQGLDRVQPYTQAQGYSISQPQCQQWGQFQFEPTVQPYSQISHQSPVQSFVSPQHRQPVRQSNMVSQNYPRVQMSEYPQVTPRPQSPPQEWAVQPGPQSQFKFMNMLPQPVANTPWIQPPSQAPVRPQGPAPQSQQQQWPQNRPEVSFQFQIQSQSLQSQPQLQVLQTPKSPKQQRAQQQSVVQVKSPALTYVRPQGPAPQQPATDQQQWPQYKADPPFQIQTQSQTFQSQSQLQVLQKPQSPEHEQPQQYSVALIIPPAQVEAPPQICSEAYSKAEELAKNKLENAKRRLKEHVLEAFNVFKGKKITQEKEPLDPELLKEFLRAVQEMEAFCTSSQLREMELFAQSVRTQWEACFCTKSGLVLTEQQLEALKQLCEILSPEDANKLAQAQLREHESTPPAIQCQSRGDDDVRPTDCGVFVEQTKEASLQNTALPEKPVEITTQTCPVTAQQPKTVEKKEILKQISTEEDRYRSSRFALQAQLNRNEQNMLGDRPSGSATATDLQKRLRELKALQDETETLWSEYDVQCSQCSQVNERAVEQDRSELTVKWREQRVQLQRRVDSLGSALELMDSIEHHVAEISERLDKFIKEPKDVKGYMLINANILKDVKDLDESIQTQMDRLTRFDSEPSHLDLRDRSPLTQLVLKHRSSLDRLRQQVRKSEAAARALDRFLVSLHTLDQDVLHMHSAPSADVTALQDSRTKLALVRKGAASLSDKAPQLDQLLGGAQMVVTQEGNSVTCLDMVAVLVQKVEDVDDKLVIRQEELQQEQQSKGLGMRKRTLLAEVRKVQGAAEKQGLKEPTMPAVQHRIRALSDLEVQMNSLRREYESIRETASKLFPNTVQRDETETVWEETERAVAERQEQCSTLMDLLKKFQSCRSFLGNILQRAEQTISEQASYMSKDNLQRLIARVCGIKEDLNGLGPKIEEFRAVCRQLQSQLKRLPDCSETPFEAEADALVDSWLDVSEKTDSYLDSLRMGLEVWEKQLILGEEREVWATAKLSLFVESHPFSSEKEVFEMKDEIQTQERSIEQFLRKSLEIQELLQSKEAPLELQVMETSLRKKTEQVKELFDSRTDVFQELLSVRERLLQRTDACQTAIQRIHSSVRMLCADSRELLQQHLQDLSDQLLDQEEEADSLTKEVELMSSVTAPEALEELSNKSKRLKDNIAVTREFIGQKKEQREKSALVQSIKDECQMFEDWLQDTQLAVNECFENPETREDVEASMQRLHDFLISEEGDHRLAQVKTALEKRGQEEIPAKAHAELCAWQQEQEGELTTLQAHCQGRHKQLEDILIKLNSLQEEHEHLQDWLRQREKLPVLREKFRQVHEDFLKESGRIEAFGDLLASVRLKGLRGDPVLRDSESLVDRYHSLGIRLENRSEIHKSLEKEIETFYINEEITRTWVKNLKQSLESLDKDKVRPAEEKLLQAQAVLELRVEGDSKMAVLKVDGESLRAREELEESTRQELIGTLRNIDDEWQNVLDSAQQIEAQAKLQQTLLKELQDLQDQEKDIRSWVDEQTRKLDFLNEETPINERHNRLQEFLSLKHEGDAKLEALRKKGQSICAHEERKRHSIEQSQRELEEEWTRVLQTAREIKNQIEREGFLSEELKSFEDQLESTQAWIRELKATLQSKAAPAEEIISQAQMLLAHGPEGDSKLAALKHTGERVCTCEGLKEDTRDSIQQAQRALEQEWREVLDCAQILRNDTEIQVTLDKELQDFNSQAEIFQTWVIDLQEQFGSPDKGAPLHETLVLLSQTMENLPEADSKVAALNSKGANLCAKLDESRKESVQRTLRDVQDKLRTLTEIAKEHKNQVERQDSLSKELETFRSEEKTTQSWVEELKKDLVSLGKSTHGTQEQIEERLNKVQAVLTLRPEGNCKMSSLKRKAESLCGRGDLDKQTRLTLVQNLKSLEEEWKEVLQNAQESNSLLRSVVERLVSCQCQRQQTQSRVEQLKQQIAALPRLFPWPGLGDRRHALEQATALLDKVRSLSTTLSALRALGREMSQLTRDPSWTDPSWTAMEDCVPGLIKDLSELSESLEEGICTERNCAQLVEQHSAAQDWLREQVKGFGSLPTDRRGLQGSINTLKALLQTVEREEREMRELDVAKDALINLCTPGGRDALTLETGHLRDLCSASEREINQSLIVCETRLADIELKIAERAESFRAQAECVLNDLRATECLGFVEGCKKISQVEENSKILKTCEKELEKIECKVRALGQAVCMVPPDEALPSNVNSLVNTVTQQYCRLQSKLSERKDDCADGVVRCMRNTLQALRSWTQSTQTQAFSDSACTVQAMIEEGAELHKNLQEAVSHKQLLRDCLGQELADKLDRDVSNALKEADALINQLQERLQDLEEERRKSKALTMSPETQTGHLVSEVSCEWPGKPDTSVKVELHFSKPQDISSAPAGSSNVSAVEPFEEARRDVDVSTIEETKAKSEQPLGTSAGDENPSEAVLTMALRQKSGDIEVSRTVTKELLSESPTEEQPPVFAVDECGAEFGKDDPPTTSLATISKQERLTDVAGSESLSHQADINVLEFDTERINPSKRLEEREFQLNTPVSTATDRDLVEEISDDVDFPTADWSLTALRIDRNKLQTGTFSTTALAAQSDKVQEVDVCAIDPGTSEGEIEMEMKLRMQEIGDAETCLERKVEEESNGHDRRTTCAQSLDRKSDAVEEANRNWSLTSDTFVLLPEEGKMAKKKIAALILDTDSVHVHTTEVPGMTDPNPGKIYLSLQTGCESSSSHQIGTSDTSDETRNRSDVRTSPDQQEMEIAVDVIDSTNSSQPSEENIDRTETRISNATNSEREGTRTTNSGPREVQRWVEPLEHWTVNNGPRETQRRYMILERKGGLEIRQEPTAETDVPALEPGTSKTGEVVTGVSELEQVVGKESAATEGSERATWNAEKQSETLEIMGAPARRELDRLPCSCEDKLVQDVEKVIVEFESTKSTTVKGETEPTPPARRSKPMDVGSEVRCEEAPLPVPTIHQNKLEEIQLPPEGIIHPPPDRTHKERLVGERPSLVLDSPTPPERRRKERAEHQQPELEKSSKTVVGEEPLIKPTPPLRQKVSQIESEGTEDLLVKPTPPTRRRDSRVVTDLVSDSSDLDKARTKERAVEESLEKTTPAVRRKSIQDESEFITPLVSKPRGTEDLLVKPTPPTRRKDSRCVRDTVSKEIASEHSQSTELEKAVMQGIAVEEKPTPTVRRKGSLLSQIQEMEDTSVKPTPPARRRASRNFSDETYEEMARKISISTDLEKTLTQENTLEESLIKPTPPARRKVSSQIESDTFSVLSKIHELGEMVVKPTPPTRRRDSRNISDIVTVKSSSSTDLEKMVTQDKAFAQPLLKPTPPMRRKSQETEATLSKPTPPVRRRNSGNITDPPASRIYGSCDLEGSILVTPERAVSEALVKPTPPFRRKTLSRTESDVSIVERTKEMEETLVKPTPPTRRRESRNVSDEVAVDLQNSVTQEKNLKGSIIKPAPTTSRKTTPAESDPSVVSKTQEVEVTLLKPTPPTRRRERTNTSDTVAGTISSSYDSENVSEVRDIKPMPSLSKAIDDESDIITVVFKPQEIDKKLEEPTPPTRRRESKNLSDLVASEISVSGDLENFGTQDRAAEEALVRPSPPEDTPVKPILLTHGKDSRTMDEIVPNQAEGDFSSMVNLGKTDVEVMEIQTPPVLQAESDLSIIAKTREMEEKLEKAITPTRRRDSRTVDETVPAQMESEIRINVLEKTFRPESADEVDLLVVQDASQAESDVTVIDKTQKAVETLERPISPTRRIESRTVDENVNIQTESEISSSVDLDNTVRPASAVEEDLVKQTPLAEQVGIQAECDKSIVENGQKMEEKLEESTSLTSRGHGRNVDETTPKQMDSSSTDVDEIVRQESAEEEDLEKITPPLQQAASEGESNISSVVPKPHVPEETPMKPTPPSQSELQDGTIEPALREENNKVEQENIKVSSISTEPEEPPPSPITPIGQEKETVDLDTIPANVEEPSIQPVQKTGDLEKSVEVQPLIKQEDEQKEKEFCNALGVERTKGLTEIESISLVEAQIKVADKSEITDQESSVAKGIDVPEAFEREQEDDDEEEEEEEPLGATMNNIFTEIEKMSKTRPNSLLIESRPYDDPMGLLSTSEADLEAQMTRLVFCILSCRNSPAVLNPTDMAKQVEEAELCRQRAQQQVSSISKQAHINGEVSTLVTRSANDPEAMQRLSCQWTEALWDASGTVHTKEAQLQLVIDYDRQLQKARATLEKMVGELESLKMCPVESSFVEEQRLRSFLRTMEQERTVLGELIQTHSQLSPHLSQPDRAAALSQQSVLQSEWKALERSAEKSLHNVSTYTKESFDLLEDIGTLKEHLENFHKILESHWISSSAWDSKRVQEMIGLGAELTAAKQRYFDVHENFEALSQSCNFQTEVYNIQQGLWSVKDHMDLIGEELDFSLPTSNNPSMVKIVKVITEALAWAKKTQYDIKNRERKVSLLPEEVHRQIKDLKKLNSDMTSKQIQLSTLTKEVTEMIPDLDQPDVPLVTSLLELLASLSKSTEERIAAAMEEIQLSLQTREKISEQITEVDSWIQSHLHKESLSREDFQSLSAADLDQRLRQSQDTLQEAEKHSGIAEALQMKSKDITSELSISENAWLYEKLSKLQEDIKGVINYEKSSILEIKDILQNRELSEQKMSSLEQKLREITTDVKGHTFPITKETLDAIEPIKRVLVEHKFQVEQINTSAEGKRRELLGVISELHHKMNTFRIKSQVHERFFSLKQRVEDLRENLELYVPKTKDESVGEEERYKICQSLLTQIPLIKLTHKEASDELLNVSPDLHPSQLTTEQERLKQNLETFNAWETAVQNNLQIVELDVLKDINYLSEQRVVHGFLKEASRVLDKTCEVEFNQGAVDDELRKLLKLQKNVEARMRVLEVLELKNGHQQGSRHSKSIAELAKSVLDQCDQRLMDLSKAKESLKRYSRGVRSAGQFLQRTESVLLLSLCSPRSCSERLKDIQQALLSLDNEFQSHLTEIQSFSPFSPLFSEQKVKQLQVEILGCLLVRTSTLKAQAQLRRDALERCVNSQRNTRVLYEELCRRVRDAETTLADCACKKITSQTDYLDQKETLKTLVKDVDALSGKLDELKEWCPVQGCRSNRDDAVNSLWGQVARLRQCTRDLLAHSEWRGEEWIRIRKSIEKASSVLEQIEADFPQSSREKATAEELSELLRFWSPYQDRLDCEHRALSALELRVVRLLRTEGAEPVPLCQDLQTMQERYHSLKSRSDRGRKATQAETEERTKVREELLGIQEWLVSAGTVLSELEREPKAERLQELYSELCTQKAVLQHIMEGLRMKYTDMYTLVPMEIDGPLQEVSQSLEEVGKQVEAAVQKSGPLHRLDAKLSEINTGLDAVHSRLKKKCPDVAEAESVQKRVSDELDSLHSCLSAVEVELQDLREEEAKETPALVEKLSQAQQLHTRLSKQAEDRTAFLKKIHGWLQEHEEMVKASQSWITESQSWLTAPYTYTTAKCLDSHVNALQMVLDDSAQIRRTLQGFESVLMEMASVCDVSGLQQELHEADRCVADMQNSLLEPLKTLEHAAAEVDAMESELRIMEKDAIELKLALTSKQGISQDKFRAAVNRIELMKRTAEELKSCKTALRLPEGAENTLTVFRSVDLLLNKLLEIEQLALEHTVVVSGPCEMSTTLRVPPTIAEEEPQGSVLEQGQVEIVRMTEDVLTRSGAVLLTVKEMTLDPRLESSAETQDTESGGETQQRPDSSEHDTQESDPEAGEGEHVASEQSEPEAVSEPSVAARTPSPPPGELVTKTPSVRELSESPPGGQQKCVVS